MQIRKLLSQAAQFGLELRGGALCQHGVRKDIAALFVSKGVAEKITFSLRPEKPPDRTCRQPVEIAGNVNPHPVSRQQINQPQAIQAQQMLQALHLSQLVVVDNIVRRPVVQDADRDQQKLLVGDQFCLLHHS